MPAYPGEIIVWSAEDERVAVYRVSLTDGSLVGKRVIDDGTIKLGGTSPRDAYGLSYVDLNGDGNKQLLYNNW